MKITFLRTGHANNSSSSHSIVFTSTPQKHSERTVGGDFGWDNFTLKSSEEKKHYAMVAIRDSFYSLCKVDSPLLNQWDKNVQALMCKKFFDWAHDKLAPEFTKEELDQFQHMEQNTEHNYHGIGYIDHESTFKFPSCREITDGLHVGFIKAWLRELLKENYIILGGNDNSDGHPLAEIDETHDNQLLYDELKSFEPKYHSCVFDKKTEEFVISYNSPWDQQSAIMKVKF